MAPVNTDDLGTVDDVRYELGDTGDELDTGLIHYHLTRARDRVGAKMADSPSATMTQIEGAIVLEAAWRLVSSNRDAFIESKQAADVRQDFDIEAWLSSLEARRDEAMQTATETGSPRLHTFGSRATPGWR